LSINKIEINHNFNRSVDFFDFIIYLKKSKCNQIINLSIKIKHLEFLNDIPSSKLIICYLSINRGTHVPTILALSYDTIFFSYLILALLSFTGLSTTLDNLSSGRQLSSLQSLIATVTASRHDFIRLGYSCNRWCQHSSKLLSTEVETQSPS